MIMDIVWVLFKKYDLFNICYREWFNILLKFCKFYVLDVM